jgi:hypothetical protein
MLFPWLGLTNKVRSIALDKDCTMYPTTTLNPEQRAQLHARARRQAQMLRRAAVADFWRAAYLLTADALRAAQRLPHRLAPHSKHPSGV